MITKEQIKAAADANGDYITNANIAFRIGAKWAIEQMQSDVQKGSELIVRWTKAWQDEKNDNAALTADNAKLRAALQNLLDEQNGPPLEKRRAKWDVAMNEARAILSK